MTSLIPVHPFRVSDSSGTSFTQSAAVSPTSSASSSDDVFSNGDARSSQSSAPSSVKGSPLTYDDSDTSALSLSQSGSDNESRLDRSAGQSLPAEFRRHPRRTCNPIDVPELRHESAGPSRKPVPTLIRQCDRKEMFVEALVDTTTEMIEVIWPASVAHCSLSGTARNILGLRKFVQEVLRRSKTSYSTLQVALFYLVLLIPHVPAPANSDCRDDPPVCRALRCGRRMFLAALILASKYLQDRNYTMLAWAKISGLKKEEICFNELAFLQTVQYNLHIPEQLFKDWADIVLKYSLEDDCRRARAANGGRCDKWRLIIPHLSADLSATSNLDIDKLSAIAQTPPSTPVPSLDATMTPSIIEQTGITNIYPLAPPSTPVPPRFLEPKALTTAELALRSPKPSKLKTPCLPPINLEYTPAAGVTRQTYGGGCASMRMAMQACAMSANRASMETLGQQPLACDFASWNPKRPMSRQGSALTPFRTRESCLRASSLAESPCDDAATAARALQDISRSCSAYPTPKSMDSLTDGSSISSETDEVSTPKALDIVPRPLLRTSTKRGRPLSICEVDDGVNGDLTQQISKLSNIVCHAGGIPVDYGAGIDDCTGRSRHVRSASGSLSGSRKRHRLTNGIEQTSH